jgi:hypothetical protein
MTHEKADGSTQTCASSGEKPGKTRQDTTSASGLQKSEFLSGQELKFNHKIYIKRTVLEQIFAYIHACDTEISGVGTVRHNRETNCFIIDSLLPLFQQVCSGGFTEIAMDDLGAYVSKHSTEYQETCMANAVVLARKNRFEEAAKALNMALDDFKAVFPAFDGRYPADQEYKKVEDLAQRINFHWHSHVRMGVFWSGEDCANATRLAKSSGASWQIVLVGNKENKYLVKFESYNPPFIVSGIELEVIDDYFNLAIERAKGEIKEKVFPMGEFVIDDKTDKIVKRPPVEHKHYSPPTPWPQDPALWDYARNINRADTYDDVRPSIIVQSATQCVSKIRNRIERFRAKDKGVTQ